MKKFFPILAGLAILLLGAMVIPGETDIFRYFRYIVIPISAGGVTGWLARRQGALFAFYTVVPILPLLVLLFLLTGLDLSGESTIEMGLLILSWLILLPISGFLGEKLYGALHKP